jgi:hypothetical protein
VLLHDLGLLNRGRSNSIRIHLDMVARCAFRILTVLSFRRCPTLPDAGSSGLKALKLNPSSWIWVHRGRALAQPMLK